MTVCRVPDTPDGAMRGSNPVNPVHPVQSLSVPGARDCLTQTMGAGGTASYAYNGDGLRVRRIDASSTKLYTYQGHNIASVQQQGGTPGDFDDHAVYTVAPGSISNVLERHDPDYQADTTDSVFYQYDHRGDVVCVTDANGQILRGYEYDAFGNIAHSFTEGTAGAAPTDDILFTGKDLDPVSGLYYFNARWYDAETGRFVSPSHLRRDKEHSYALCEGNALCLVDFSGNDPSGVRDGILGVLATALAPACPIVAVPIIGGLVTGGAVVYNEWQEPPPHEPMQEPMPCQDIEDPAKKDCCCSRYCNNLYNDPDSPNPEHPTANTLTSWGTYQIPSKREQSCICACKRGWGAGNEKQTGGVPDGAYGLY